MLQSDDPARLTASDILRVMQVPGWPRLFVLSPFEKPVNVMSQQLRAINLVHALIEARLLKQGGPAPRTRLAIIGGGVAGTTAAAYAALEGYGVTLFERQNAELGLFANSNRYLDPILYDWPDFTPGQRAAIPVMSWRGGRARDVTESLLAQWKGWVRLHDIDVHHGAKVTLPEAALPSLDGQIELTFHNAHHPTGEKRRFDAVILALGFGPEQLPTNQSLRNFMQRFTYWDREASPDWLRPRERTVLISGTGDGGLTDLFWVALKDFSEKSLEDFVRLLREEPSNVAGDVAEIERQVQLSVDAGLRDVSEFITRRYMDIKTPVLNAHLRARLQDVQITLNGGEQAALTDKSYPINRFITSRLLQIAEETRSSPSGFSLRYVSGHVECWKTNEGFFGYDTRSGNPLNEGRPFSTAIIRRGPRHVLKEAYRHIYERCEAMQGRTYLGLARRATWPAPYLARSLQDDPKQSPLRGVVRRHVFYSDFFDSTVQRALCDLMMRSLGEEEGEMRFRALYFGKLRLALLLHGTVLLTDTQVLDGAFFLGLGEEEIRRLAPRLRLVFRAQTVADSTLAMLCDRDKRVRAFEFSAIRKHDVREKVRVWLRLQAERQEIASEASGLAQLLTITKDVVPQSELNPLIEGWTAWDGALRDLHTQPRKFADGTMLIDRQVVDPGRLYGVLKLGQNLFHQVYKQRNTSRTNIYAVLSHGLPEGAEAAMVEDAWKVRSFYNAAYNAGIARKEGANVIETVWVDGADAFAIDCEHRAARRSCLGELVAMLGALGPARFDEVEANVRRTALRFRCGLLPIEDLLAAIRDTVREPGHAPAPGVASELPLAPSRTREDQHWSRLVRGLLGPEAFVASSVVPHNLDKGDSSTRLVTGQWSAAHSEDSADVQSPLTITHFDRALWRAPDTEDLLPEWCPEALPSTPRNAA